MMSSSTPTIGRDDDCWKSTGGSGHDDAGKTEVTLEFVMRNELGVWLLDLLKRQT